MFYLEDVELARQLVELGWVGTQTCSLQAVHVESSFATGSQRRIRGNGEVIKREEFETRKETAEGARQARLNKKPKKLASQGKDVEQFPLLQVR
jgi:hypothetical protein